MRHLPASRATAALLVFLGLTACHSWRTVPPNDLAPEQPPATVRVTLLGGQTLVLNNATTRRDTLVGQDRSGGPARLARTIHIPVPDIEQLELRRFDAGKTVGRTIGLGLPLAVVLRALIVEALTREGGP